MYENINLLDEGLLDFFRTNSSVIEDFKKVSNFKVTLNDIPNYKGYLNKIGNNRYTVLAEAVKRLSDSALRVKSCAGYSYLRRNMLINGESEKLYIRLINPITKALGGKITVYSVNYIEAYGSPATITGYKTNVGNINHSELLKLPKESSIVFTSSDKNELISWYETAKAIFLDSEANPSKKGFNEEIFKKFKAANDDETNEYADRYTYYVRHLLQSSLLTAIYTVQKDKLKIAVKVAKAALENKSESVDLYRSISNLK